MEIVKRLCGKHIHAMNLCAFVCICGSRPTWSNIDVMALHLRTVRIGSPRQPREGIRIGAVRFLPRGVPKAEYRERDLFDVWLPILAPSRELLKSFLGGKLSPARFFQRYKREMSRPDARQVIQLLALLAAQTPLSVACFCEEESRCHRRALGALIREAADPG